MSDAVYTIVQADRVEVTKATVTATPVTGGVDVTGDDATETVVEALPGVELDKVAGPVVDVDGNGVDAGDSITFSFVVSNVGNVDVDGVTLDDGLLGLVDAPCGSGPWLSATTRACPDAVYTIVVADLGGEVTNSATVTATAPNGDTVSASDGTTTSAPAAPSVALDKQSSGVTDVDGNGVDAGDTLTYAFVVTNTGNVPLDGITLDDPLLDLTAAPCPSGPLASGASRTCPPATYVLTEVDLGASIENTASVSAVSAAGDAVSASDVLVTAVPPACSTPTTTEAPESSPPGTEQAADLAPDSNPSTTEPTAESSPESNPSTTEPVAEPSPESNPLGPTSTNPEASTTTTSSSAPGSVGPTTTAAGNAPAPGSTPGGFARPGAGGGAGQRSHRGRRPVCHSHHDVDHDDDHSASDEPARAPDRATTSTTDPGSSVAPTSAVGPGPTSGPGRSRRAPYTLPASGAGTAAPVAVAAISMSLLGVLLILSARARPRDEAVVTRSDR